MAIKRFTIRVLAVLTLWAGFGLTAAAQLPPLTTEKALELRPRQPVSLPAVDAAKCRVDPIPNPKAAGTNMGYVVRDAQNKPVRQFVTYDNKQFNIISFYVDGQEAYREVYPPEPNQPYQFRWLGPNGGKWGLDRDRDGRVDEWAVISQEEVGQEVLDAVLSRDPKRLEPLLVTKENLDAIGLPAAQAGPILARARGAAARLTKAADELKLTPEAKWDHLESRPPTTTPADLFGGREDLVVQKSCTVLIQDGKEMKFLQVGELIQVGRAWKVIDGPGSGPAMPDVPVGATDGPPVVPVIAELVKQLDEIDKGAPNPPTPETLAAYYTRRVAVLEQIVQKLPPEQQPAWVRLLVDSLGAAAEAGKADNAALVRLRQLKEVLGKSPQSPLAAYSAFRVLQAENRIALRDASSKELAGVQEKWRAALESFIKAHPTSEDAPEAVLQLAMAYDYLGKEGEEKAKSWYDHLVKNYPQHHHAAKAAGAKRRLESEGKTLELTGPNLANGQPFNVAGLAGKVVIVYYWASWSSTLPDDVKKLKELVATYGPKGMEVVAVCLDDDPAVAARAVQAVQMPGTHIHMRGGLDHSPLAAAYGILVPPHVILAGKDGKVINKNAQVMSLEDELKKLLP